MPKRKVVPYKRESVKTCFNPYSLQELHADQFIRAVTRILAGQATLIQFADRRQY